MYNNYMYFHTCMFYHKAICTSAPYDLEMQSRQATDTSVNGQSSIEVLTMQRLKELG